MVLGDPKRQGDRARVRRPPVPGLQGLLRRSAPADHRKPGPQRRSEAELPQLHDHRRTVDPRRRRGRSPPASRAAAGTSSSSSTATRASSAPATSPTSSSPRSPKAPGFPTSPSGTRTAKARPSSTKSKQATAEAQKARLHRHAVVRDRRPGHQWPRSAGNARSAACSKKESKRRLGPRIGRGALAARAALTSSRHNHHYRALDPHRSGSGAPSAPYRGIRHTGSWARCRGWPGRARGA